MPRRYRRRRYAITRPLKTTKYSNETFAAATGQTWNIASYYNSVCIPAAQTLGTRKCKNFTLTIVSKSANADYDKPMYFALVFVPEGTTPNSIRLGSTLTPGTDTTPATLQSLSYYEPNQNVIIQGFVDNTQVYRFKTRLARNLNSGDTIVLVWRPFDTYTQAGLFSYTLNYAMSY